MLRTEHMLVHAAATAKHHSDTVQSELRVLISTDAEVEAQRVGDRADNGDFLVVMRLHHCPCFYGTSSHVLVVDFPTVILLGW